MERNERGDVFEAYCDNNFRTVEGESGVRNLEQLVETLGYGEGFMRNRAIEDFLTDNPGAVEAVLQFIGEWVERNNEWAERLKESLVEDGLLEEEE